MAFQFTLLILPAIVSANIEVNLTGELISGNWDMIVPFVGKDVGVITDTEMKTFNLSDDTLKHTINTFLGARPANVSLRNPPPWGSTNQSYAWNPITRTIKVVRVKFLNVSGESVLIHQKKFENNASKSATFDVKLSKEVQNTISSSWNVGGELSVSEIISHGIHLVVGDIGDGFYFFYTLFWGQNVEHKQTVIVSTLSKNIVLKPGQSVDVELYATRVTVQLEIEYESYLSGNVAAYYDEVHKGYQIWVFDIKTYMRNASLVNSIVSREVINLEFYSDARVKVLDNA